MINQKDARTAVAAEQAARKELKDHTYQVVQAMRAQLRSRQYADGYMAGVTTGLEPGVVLAAYKYFEDAWEDTATPE